MLSLLWVVGLAACGGPTLDESGTLARMEQAHDQGPLTGAIRWARQISGEPVIIGEFPAEKYGRLVKDGEEHLLALYSFTGNIDLGDRVVRAPGGPTSSALALARYDQKKGRLEWVKVFGPGPGVDGGVFGRNLAVDSKHNILIAVGALGVDFGDGPVWEGEYLLKFDRHGQLLWKRSWEANPGFVSVFDLLTDNQDNILLTGTLVGTVDFGSGPISSRPDPAEGFFGPSPFVTKYTPGGENLWAYAHVSSQFGEGLGATVDSQDHILLCGSVSSQGSSAFVLRISPDGHLRWERYVRFSGGSGRASDVAAHGDRIVLTGTFSGTFTFGGRTVTSDTSRPVQGDAFLVAYTREGKERWARNFGFLGERIAMDQKDGVVVTGSYHDGDDLGLGPLPGKGEGRSNLFVAKYDRIDGEPLWTRGFPAGLAEPSSLVTTKDGRPAVLGSFRSGSLILDDEEWPQKSPNDLFLIGLDR
ncbi:hypothetical protein JRI60_30235 [Archangium violaceum]|uniref:hypothetical protein n=1 Tax=Archangium violaceum TaxID=83451 RepID=UPI00194F65A2|nr:hypothetical protein [Archangium violaceum]QRN93455.1 hypothetical protein JRI60_30235 [Archangium violaceum]